MDPERWQQIKSAFDTVVEMDDVERATRLKTLRTSDPELLAAVELLLAADSDAAARLASLDAVFFPPSTPASDPLGLAGQTISHFEIREGIGAGGIGVVYRAEDTRLGRAVALKFLLPSHSLDASAKARFLREAHLVAALDHPNLCTIHDVGTSDDGRFPRDLRTRTILLPISPVCTAPGPNERCNCEALCECGFAAMMIFPCREENFL